ncbi:branched-chain amino acid ABC transporter permease [Pseudohoeflea coraliihabitans]|uniref:Branched-chain amino acid ABC transporter permease n=1 Tax=Pseudohoeflea coraliihabitans TaxID=2860393 RepID=A0ABS6WMN2_9HYPH|nr:branched-chain amino acid ABC transporter permease [Pseudohoeflea sp. DP4N28-3]MBW3096672.1 branched-chain amino acid ABC transporter permease [Pseudohoeflea sp. DP4N28-3]
MRDRLDISMRANHVFFAVLMGIGLICVALAVAMNDTFYLRLGTEALILGGLALSVDILLGFGGLLSLGQALYFGIGAYVSALVLREVPSFWLAMAAATGVTLLAGIIGGLIANRVRGVYFALITFGMAQVVAKVVYNTRELGASDGLIGVPVLEIPLGVITVSAGDPLAFFLLTLSVLTILYAAVAYLFTTPFGRVVIALKANEKRVPFLGYNTWGPRMVCYVVAALVAGITGALYPMLRGFVSPELMFFASSGNAVIMVVLGGVGTLIGALYGAVLLTFLKSVVGSYTEHHLIAIGVIFIFAILFMPKGIIGVAKPSLERRLIRFDEQTDAARIKATGERA